MISLKEIHDEIKRIEQSNDTSWTSVQRLSWLYIVRNNLEIGKAVISENDKKEINGFTPVKEGSDFLLLASQKSPDGVIAVMDDLMETIRTLYPRMYDAVMKRIYDL